MQYSVSRYSTARFLAIALMLVCTASSAGTLRTMASASRVKDVCPAPGMNRLYAATDGGLLEYDMTGNLLRTYGVADGLGSHRLLGLVKASDRIWMASPSGAGFLEDGKITWFTVDSGLPANRLYCVAVDGKGTVYAGTHRGIARFGDDRFEDVIDSHEFARRPTYDIHRSSDSSLWFAKANGMTHLLPNGTWQTYQRDILRSGGKKILPSNSILSIASDSSGRTWIGTKMGVAVKDGDEWTEWLYRDRFDYESGPMDNRIVDIAVDQNDSIWIAHGDSKDFDKAVGVGRFDGNRWDYFTAEDGLVSDRVYGIRTDGMNRTWLAASGGVCVISNESVSVFALLKSPLPSNQILDIVNLGAGRVSVITARAAVQIAASQLGSSSVSTVLEEAENQDMTCSAKDKTGSLWSGSKTPGLFRTDPSGTQIVTVNGQPLAVLVTCLDYDDEQNALWIGTASEGIMRLSLD